MFLKKNLFITLFALFYLKAQAKYDGWKRVYNNILPFTASIQYIPDDTSNDSFDPNIDDNGLVHFCTGTILTSKTVLTTASCFDNIDENASIFVKVGVIDKTSIHKAQVIEVSKIIIHPNYKKGHLRPADIALLSLKRAIKFKKNIQAIHLANKKFLAANSNKGIISGWGGLLASTRKSSNSMFMADVSVISNEECKSYYTRLNSGQLCITGETSENAPCQGNSGIPLMQMDQEVHRPVLYGLASTWPRDCEGPAIFTAIDEYTDFIKENLY